MTIASVAPLLFTRLVTNLAARAALAGVQISSGPLGRSTLRESIQLYGTQPARDEWAALGNLAKDETFEIYGALYVQKAGDDETIIRATRDRCYALLAEIASELIEDPHLGTDWSGVIQLLDSDMTQGSNVDGRWCEVDFRIGVRARIVAS